MILKIIILFFCIGPLIECRPQYSGYCTVPCPATYPCYPCTYAPSSYAPCVYSTAPGMVGTSDATYDPIAQQHATSILIVRRDEKKSEPAQNGPSSAPSSGIASGIASGFQSSLASGLPSSLASGLTSGVPENATSASQDQPKRSRLFTSLCSIPGAVVDSLLSGEVTV